MFLRNRRTTGDEQIAEAIYGERLRAKESPQLPQDSHLVHARYWRRPWAVSTSTGKLWGTFWSSRANCLIFERVGLYCKSVRFGEFREFHFLFSHSPRR